MITAPAFAKGLSFFEEFKLISITFLLKARFKGLLLRIESGRVFFSNREFQNPKFFLSM